MWTRPEFAALASIIAEHTGLTFPASRRRDVEAALLRAFGRHGPPDGAQLETLLREDTRARDELIAELTVGESYFFRDHEQFALLREQVLPELSVLTRGRALRIWSAGCSTGEEPYSIAVLCGELGRDDAQILGTDISTVRLAAATRGLYTKWSLRGVRDEVCRQYFAQHGRTYALSPTVRERVEFRYLNLAEDRYPSLASGVWGMDLILCRNVLIYFDRETVARVARRLLASLSDDGWLLLGASDPAFGELVDCDVVLTKAGLAYRRPGRHQAGRVAVPVGEQPWIDRWVPEQPIEDEPATAAAPGVEAPTEPAWFPTPAAVPAGAQNASAEAAAAEPEVVSEPTGTTAIDEAPVMPDRDRALAAIADAYVARDYARAASLAERLIVTRDSPTARVYLVRALANRGDLEHAGRAAAAAVDAHRASAELIYLHAVLLAQSGRAHDAAAAARRALYLDRSLVPAHLTLAAALRRKGDVAGARRALTAADRLLAGFDDDARVPAADGATASRLRASVRAQLSLLEAA